MCLGTANSTSNSSIRSWSAGAFPVSSGLNDKDDQHATIFVKVSLQ